MSTTHCEHGAVISDTMGDYRCWRCEPPTVREYRRLQARIDELERVVAQLADSAGLVFEPPPEDPDDD